MNSSIQLTLDSLLGNLLGKLGKLKNENIKGGLGQCAAAMLAAQLFNEPSVNDVNE